MKIIQQMYQSIKREAVWAYRCMFWTEEQLQNELRRHRLALRAQAKAMQQASPRKPIRFETTMGEWGLPVLEAVL